MAWRWEPGILLAADAPVYRVTASDAESAGTGCALAGALKARPQTFPDTGGWRYRRGDRDFALGPFTKALERVHRSCERGGELDSALALEKKRFGAVHPGLKLFLAHALDQYFDYHESREQELGRLRYLGLFNELMSKPGSTVMAWAPMYETESGVREIRRLRFDSARSAHTAWADFAAYIAAESVTGREIRQVFVTEIGLRDGLEHHVIAGENPQESRDRFIRQGGPAARAVVEGVTRTPGPDCETCKFAGACPELVPAPGTLQVDRPAAWTRSVSAHDLALYDRCPSRWYMQRLLKLPREADDGDAVQRGTSVHAWIDHAHRRGVPCRHEHVSDSGPLTGEEHLAVMPFLTQHVEVCPFRMDAFDVIATEATMLARDSAADVIVAAKPDLLLRRGSTLVVREIKTTNGPLPGDPDAAREQYFAVSFDLVLLAHGLIERHGCTSGEVELEILTPHENAVFPYSTADSSSLQAAREDVRVRARPWAEDETWRTHPGAHCAWCPVRHWCPDRDAHTTAAQRELPPPF